MKIVVKIDEISTFKEKIMAEINKMEDCIRKLEVLKNNFIWKGEAYNKYIVKFDENIVDIKEKMASLVKLVDVLDTFLSNYDKAHGSVLTDFKRIKGAR